MAQPESGWRARSLVCGYFASTAMLVVLMVSYALMIVLAAADNVWAEQLTNNTLTVAARNFPYVAIIVHFLIGTGFALFYGGYLEPRMQGPAWRKGVLCALGLYMISIMLLGLAMVGFGMDAGAGALLGNLILHLAYGVTLGSLFSLLSRAENGVRGHAVRASSRRGAYGLVLGGIGGLMVASGALFAMGSDGFAVANFPDTWVNLAGFLTGSALGCLIGVVGGEDGRRQRRPHLVTNP